MSSAVLRPGVAIGTYPQREDVRDGWLDRTAASLAGTVRQTLRWRRPAVGRFALRVDAEAGDLGQASDAELTARIRDLRRDLYGLGLKDALVARSFALIRELAGRRLKMRHFDVQLFGGWVMLNGMLAEMETGEGKTLTATLPACTAAMAGIPVHIVTVNDFLVSRDAAWMEPLYTACGLTVGTIVEGMSGEERRRAYGCDVTYCTNKQLVFDYLRDRIVLGQRSRRLHLQLEGLHSRAPRSRQLLLRGLCYAIVDEADSVLIDEARTPLIISRSSDSKQEERAYREALRVARKLRPGHDFALRGRERTVDLTEVGRNRLTMLTRGADSVWSGTNRREDLVKRALSALHLFERDKHYLVNDGKVQIVDEYTGRVMPDRSWERGLHQLVEMKEGCELTGRQETLARISYQRFFRRYLRLAGMTGTCREVSGELWSVYRLNVVAIPTNRPLARVALPDTVYAREADKWRAIVARASELYRQGRPVLVGTRSVAASERLSDLLNAAGLPHQVLNARQNQMEAEIVAQAGQPGRITVATNMAGRGTDIRLAHGVAALGGLHVIASERHEARRIDRQLYGRAGRQGDPGSYEAIVSLEDELVVQSFGTTPADLFARLRAAGQPVPRLLGGVFPGYAQATAERVHASLRRSLMKTDDQIGDMLAFSGSGE